MSTVRRLTLLSFTLALLLGLVTPLLAEETLDTAVFSGLLADEPQSVSGHNSPRPPSKIAENVTVITAEQIARLNAHTLADILNTVPGVQLSGLRTPGGSIQATTINSINETNILLLIDGVPQNDLVSNRIFVAWIPAGIIERVEVIKGASSAAWGPALGGVINVVTKSPDSQRKVGGLVSASYGEKQTTDLNAETSGSQEKFGFYLYGGTFHSDGLMPGTGQNYNNLFSKLTYNLPKNGIISLSGSLHENHGGIEEDAALDFRDTQKTRVYAANLTLLQPLTPDLTLLVIADINKSHFNTVWGQITYDPPYMNLKDDQRSVGAKAELTWSKAGNSLTAGAAYRNLRYHDYLSWDGGPDVGDSRKVDRGSGYLNGALEIGRLTLLPGIRFDHTGISGDKISYALGATYRLTDKTILRVYGGDGYGLPAMKNSSSDLQQIWSVQTGVESSEIPYLWLKANLFYSRLSDVETIDFSDGSYLRQDEVRQGYDVEVKTAPLYHLSAGVGYTWVDSYVRHDGSQIIVDAPTNSLKLSLDYNNSASGSSALLLGNYVWWNVQDSSADAYYKPIVWDLFLNQKLFPSSETSPELFFSGHNLFKGSQYNHSLYKNPGRWIEGGVRFSF